MSNETLNNNVDTSKQVNILNYSQDLFESFIRKWKSRCDLLDLVLRYIKVKDYTIHNVHEMITQNYEWTCLSSSIKDTAGNLRWRKWRKQISNIKDFKSLIFPFEISDEQFCNFLFLSNPWNYYLDNIKIQFWPKYGELKTRLDKKDKEIKKRAEELEDEYKNKSKKWIWIVNENRRVWKDIAYDLDQYLKDKFIASWLEELNKEMENIKADIKKEENKFYAEYPYLRG